MWCHFKNPKNSSVTKTGYIPIKFTRYCVLPFRQRYTKPRLDPEPSEECGFDRLPSLCVSGQLTPETISPCNSPVLEYRILGLTWFTAGITNSCHMDGFLSAFVRRVRQTHGFVLKKITCLDRVGDALVKIACHAILTKNSIDSELVKVLWLDAVMDEDYEKPFDAKGYEDASIFQHLLNHSGLNLRSTCECGPQYYATPYLRLRDFGYLQPMLYGGNIAYPELPTCQNCAQRRKFIEVIPVRTAWVFIVRYINNDNPNFENIPLVIDVRGILYQLGYLSYLLPGSGIQLGHKVSLQNIRGNWYVHDSAKTPTFCLWDNTMKYDVKGAILEAAVYFKV